MKRPYSMFFSSKEAFRSFSIRLPHKPTHLSKVCFAENLRAAMLEFKLTQAQLGNLVGMSQSGIGKYLKGNIPNAVNLYLLSQALGVSMEDLLVGEPQPSKSRSTATPAPQLETCQETLFVSHPVKRARQQLKDKGWSQLAAAPQLGVHHVHLNFVLTGVRQSQALLTRIANLPTNPKK